MRRVSILFLLLALSVVERSLAQTDGSIIGIYAKALLVSHTADFQELPGTQSCCAGFTTGTGFGISAGGEVWLPLSSTVHVGGLLGVIWQDYSLTSEEDTYVIINGVGQPGLFEHQLTGTMFSIGVEPRLSWSPLSWLQTSVGAAVAIPVTTTYQQQDQIIEPADQGTFIGPNGEDTGSRTRNRYSGSLPDPSITISPTLSLAAAFPLNTSRTWFIGPEITGQLGVTNIISGVDWRSSALGIGIRVTHVSRPASAAPVQPQAPVSDDPIVLIEFSPDVDSLSTDQQKRLISEITRRQARGAALTVEYRPSLDPATEDLQQRRVDFLRRLFLSIPNVDADIMPYDQGITTQQPFPLDIFRVRFIQL